LQVIERIRAGGVAGNLHALPRRQVRIDMPFYLFDLRLHAAHLRVEIHVVFPAVVAQFVELLL